MSVPAVGSRSTPPGAPPAATASTVTVQSAVAPATGATTTTAVTATASARRPQVGDMGAHPGRPIDELDLAAARSIIDLHADTPLHNLALEGDGNPGFFMRVWMAIINFFAIFVPSLRNFFRHVTRETLDHEKRGLQVFSIATEGLPPFFRASHQAYTQLPGNWPSHANDSPFNAFLFQAAWIYREASANPDRVELGRGEDGRVRGVLNTSEVLGAISRDRIALQIGIEGAFPLEVQEDDVAAYRALLANPDNQLPSDFPLPTETEIATTEGRLAYMQRIGVSYMGLNHLDSSCWSGSDLFTASARHSGLTDRGRELVRLFDRTGMILDMAHASQNAQLDAAGMVERGEYSLPLLVSHSVHQLGDEELHWRMTNPRVLDAVRSTGGVVGIMFARTHLPDPTVHGIVDQIDAVVARIGMDYVAFGSDADGFVGLPFENLGEGYDQIMAEMRRRGYSEEDIMKIRGGNYLHAMQRREHVLASRTERERTEARRSADSRDPARTLAPRSSAGASIAPRHTD